MSELVAELNENTFDSTISGSDKVLIDFWAEWCGPCRAVAPILDEIATENSDAVTIAKVDVDANQALAMKYQVQSIPTMLIFENGEMTKRIVGAKSKEDLLTELEIA